MKMFFNTILATLTLAALLLAGCGSVPQNADNALNVLASTTFLADITQNVAGDRAQVVSLLPIGSDPHAYQATPADVVKISESTILILNGIEYEHFIKPLLENADGERLVIVASDGLELHLMEKDAGDEHEGEEEHEAGDPHMWLDPNLVITYVENIRDGLSQADPGGAEVYRSNAEAYIAQLKDLDSFIKSQVESIPAERRLLVTNHEALGYFAERYGFTIVDTILPSFSSEASASAQEVASAIEKIKLSGAPAIFLGEVENDSLAEQIASETDIKVVRDLYLETLTDGPPAATYIEMMKYNVTQIADALK
ncbi:MAG: zinc ABC transporter substrate-binding protein [Anaerolineales bacterium]|nr:zinc ABC transporter substrate-binding protein [Anaerolineales bacterium]